MKKRSIYFIIVIASFLIVTRFWHADIFPAALTHDEVVYAVQAKSFAVQGKSLNQEFRPWSLQPLHPLYAEFPALLMTPFFWITNNLFLSTRLISLIIGITFPFLLALFSFGLWKNKKVSYVVLCVAAVNPLLWQMSRLTYDAVLSTYFYLFGATILLLVKGRRSLLALIPFVIGFFCYQGYKLIFLPWVFVLTLLIFSSRKNLTGNKIYLSILACCIALFVGYTTYLLPHQKVENRWHNTIFADQKYQSDNVNDERRIAIQSPLSKIFSNKVVIIGKFIGGRFLEAYSPGYLFISGEPSQSGFSAWGYGWFHAFESVFIVIGLFTLGKSKKTQRSAVLLVCFMALSTIPATLNAGNPWYLLRMFFPNVLLILFIAWGVYAVFTSVPFGKPVVLGLYTIGILTFSYHYYFRYPVSGLNLSYFSERIMAEYVARVSAQNPDRKIIVYTIDPPVLFWIYLLYTQGITKESVNQIAKIEHDRAYTFGNITFSTDCVDLSNETDLLVAEPLQVATPCSFDNRKNKEITREAYQAITDLQQHSNLTIQSVTDNGAFWRIYNNSLCDKKTLTSFVRLENFASFHTQKQSDAEFCSKWISNVF